MPRTKQADPLACRLMGAVMVMSDPEECRAILEQLPPETVYELGETIARPSFPARPARSEQGQHIRAFFGQKRTESSCRHAPRENERGAQ
jgi:hypothetical protein